MRGNTSAICGVRETKKDEEENEIRIKDMSIEIPTSKAADR